MTSQSPAGKAAPGNVIDLLDRKARKLYPLMPERLARAAMVKDFERLHKQLLFNFAKKD